MNGNHYTFDFWNSYSDEEYKALGSTKYRRAYDAGQLVFRKYDTKLVDDGRGGLKAVKDMRDVTAYDVLTCITKSDPGTFEDFCGEFGYDSDSKRAEQTYFAVQKEWAKVRRFFTPEELAEIQEIN